ncbi:MAG TPA: hypothetical protein VK487_03730 [Candidatus Bathyarchaeia archaeon]|nr:hypothetical protein [Candidatus Bathyarchaeia archaeon]
MPDRKRTNEVLDSDMPRFEDSLLESDTIQLGSGYSILLDSANEAQVVYVKTYGEVDLIALRKEIGRHYPGAKIEGLTSNTPLRVTQKRRSKSGKKSVNKR